MRSVIFINTLIVNNGANSWLDGAIILRSNHLLCIVNVKTKKKHFWTDCF